MAGTEARSADGRRLTGTELLPQGQLFAGDQRSWLCNKADGSHRQLLLRGSCYFALEQVLRLAAFSRQQLRFDLLTGRWLHLRTADGRRRDVDPVRLDAALLTNWARGPRNQRWPGQREHGESGGRRHCG